MSRFCCIVNYNFFKLSFSVGIKWFFIIRFACFGIFIVRFVKFRFNTIFVIRFVTIFVKWFTAFLLNGLLQSLLNGLLPSLLNGLLPSLLNGLLLSLLNGFFTQGLSFLSLPVCCVPAGFFLQNIFSFHPALFHVMVFYNHFV